MDDLISRVAAIEAVYYNPYSTAVGMIKKVPAVDAVPVVHARWIERDGYDGDTYYECAECQYPFCTTTGESPEAHGINYCPHCGAKMDGERRDSE